MTASTELLVLEDRLAILSRPTGVAAYDFDFRLHFTCRHPYRLDAEIDGILRIGAPEDYTACHAEALSMGCARSTIPTSTCSRARSNAGIR